MTKIIPNYFCICHSLKDKDTVRHYGTGNCTLVARTIYGQVVAELRSYSAKECIRFIRKHIKQNQFVWLVTNWHGIHHDAGFVWCTQSGKKEPIDHYED